MHIVVDWEREKDTRQKHQPDAPVENQNANGHDHHAQNAGGYLIQNVHGVVLQIVEVGGHSGGQLTHAVVVEEAHGDIPQPVTQGDALPGHKFKSCGTLQPVYQVFENAAQSEPADD